MSKIWIYKSFLRPLSQSTVRFWYYKTVQNLAKKRIELFRKIPTYIIGFHTSYLKSNQDLLKNDSWVFFFSHFNLSKEDLKSIRTLLCMIFCYFLNFYGEIFFQCALMKKIGRSCLYVYKILLLLIIKINTYCKYLQHQLQIVKRE